MHGLYNFNGQTSMQREILSNIAPFDELTISFTFYSIDVDGDEQGRFQFSYGWETATMVDLKTMFLNVTDCTDTIPYTQVYGVQTNQKPWNLLSAASILCIEQYTVTINPVTDDAGIVLKFSNTNTGNSKYYYGFNNLCLTQSHATAIHPTPSPLSTDDFDWPSCPKYSLGLSDFTVINDNGQLSNFNANSQGTYTFTYINSPTQSSDWILSSSTYIQWNAASSIALSVNIDTSPNSCQDSIVAIQDSDQFIAVKFNQYTVGFYPECGELLATIPSPSLYDYHWDPLQNLTFDINNLEWEKGLDKSKEIIILYDPINDQTTARIRRSFEQSVADVDFKCIWNGSFSQSQVLKMSLATSTVKFCKINDIGITHCDISWEYGLDFCENTTSSADMSLWSASDTASIDTRVVHGVFAHSNDMVKVVYNNVPNHAVVYVGTNFYISTAIAAGNSIEFNVGLNGEWQNVVTYIGDGTACVSGWDVIGSYCQYNASYDGNTVQFMSNQTDLNVSISVNVIVGTDAFNWAFDGLCIHQSFRITKAPSPAPSRSPTVPTTPTTSNPTTISPTTSIPTTATPTTSNPTTISPTTITPTTSTPTTSNPTTIIPTTSVPTTSNPTTISPTTSTPTTAIPTTSNPTTITPTTNEPTTSSPTPVGATPEPTTSTPTTSTPTTSNPTTTAPTTSIPTTITPTTTEPTTNIPTTSLPTTNNPTTNMPTTIAPTSQTSTPTTIAPTSQTSTPTTSRPTTTNPTTTAHPSASPTSQICTCQDLCDNRRHNIVINVNWVFLQNNIQYDLVNMDCCIFSVLNPHFSTIAFSVIGDFEVCDINMHDIQGGTQIDSCAVQPCIHNNNHDAIRRLLQDNNNNATLYVIAANNNLKSDLYDLPLTQMEQELADEFLDFFGISFYVKIIIEKRSDAAAVAGSNSSAPMIGIILGILAFCVCCLICGFFIRRRQKEKEKEKEPEIADVVDTGTPYVELNAKSPSFDTTPAATKTGPTGETEMVYAPVVTYATTRSKFTETDVGKLFDYFDTDKDAEISELELMLLLQEIGVDVSDKEKMNKITKDLARDNDGMIHRDDFIKWFMDFPLDSYNVDSAARIIAAYDELSEEQIEIVFKNEYDLTEKDIGTLFGWFDEDNDDKISSQELEQILQEIGVKSGKDYNIVRYNDGMVKKADFIQWFAGLESDDFDIAAVRAILSLCPLKHKILQKNNQHGDILTDFAMYLNRVVPLHDDDNVLDNYFDINTADNGSDLLAKLMDGVLFSTLMNMAAPETIGDDGIHYRDNETGHMDAGNMMHNLNHVLDACGKIGIDFGSKFKDVDVDVDMFIDPENYEDMSIQILSGLAKHILVNEKNTLGDTDVGKLFDYFDTDKDAKISESELMQLLQAIGVDVSDKEQMDKIMAALVNDDDGMIHRDDFIQWFIPLDYNMDAAKNIIQKIDDVILDIDEEKKEEKTGKNEGNLSAKDIGKLFDYFDADHNGMISEQELQQLLEEIGVNCNVREDKGMIKKDDFITWFGTLDSADFDGIAVDAIICLSPVKSNTMDHHDQNVKDLRDYAIYLNRVIPAHEDTNILDDYFDIDITDYGTDLLAKLLDGVLLSTLINLAVPKTIDEDLIHFKDVISGDKIEAKDIVDNLKNVLAACNIIGIDFGRFNGVDVDVDMFVDPANYEDLAIQILSELSKIYLAQKIDQQHHMMGDVNNDSVDMDEEKKSDVNINMDEKEKENDELPKNLIDQLNDHLYDVDFMPQNPPQLQLNAVYLNDVIAEHKMDILTEYLPINEDDNGIDLLSKLSDGVILNHMINIAVPKVIDENLLSFDALQPMDAMENVHVLIAAAKIIGIDFGEDFKAMNLCPPTVLDPLNYEPVVTHVLADINKMLLARNIIPPPKMTKDKINGNDEYKLSRDDIGILFDYFDTDHDGVISPGELMKLLQEIGVDAGNVDKITAILDSGDGKIKKDDFINWWFGTGSGDAIDIDIDDVKFDIAAIRAVLIASGDKIVSDADSFEDSFDDLAAFLNDVIPNDEATDMVALGKYFEIKSGDTGQDMFDKLLDGVLLAELVNIIVPGTIDPSLIQMRDMENFELINPSQIVSNLQYVLAACKLIGVDFGKYNDIFDIGKIFDYFDSNQDAIISVGELTDLLDKLGVDVSDTEKLNAIIASFDMKIKTKTTQAVATPVSVPLDEMKEESKEEVKQSDDDNDDIDIEMSEEKKEKFVSKNDFIDWWTHKKPHVPEMKEVNTDNMTDILIESGGVRVDKFLDPKHYQNVTTQIVEELQKKEKVKKKKRKRKKTKQAEVAKNKKKYFDYTPEQVYDEYVKRYGYAPKTPNHLMYFAREIGSRIRFVDCRKVIGHKKRMRRQKKAEKMKVEALEIDPQERKRLLRLSKPKLARLCKQMKISTKGNKGDLVNRILEMNAKKAAKKAKKAKAKKKKKKKVNS